MSMHCCNDRSYKLQKSYVRKRGYCSKTFPLPDIAAKSVKKTGRFTEKHLRDLVARKTGLLHSSYNKEARCAQYNVKEILMLI